MKSLKKQRLAVLAVCCLLSAATAATVMWFTRPKQYVTVPEDGGGKWKEGYDEGYSKGVEYGREEVSYRIAPEVIAGDSAPADAFGQAYWRLGWQKGYAEGAALDKTPQTADITVSGSFTAEVLEKTESGALTVKLCAAEAPFDAPFLLRTDAALSAQTEKEKAYTFTVPEQTCFAVPAEWLKDGSNEADLRLLFSASQPIPDAVREADDSEKEPLPAGTPSCTLTGKRITE